MTQLDEEVTLGSALDNLENMWTELNMLLVELFDEIEDSEKTQTELQRRLLIVQDLLDTAESKGSASIQRAFALSRENSEAMKKVIGLNTAVSATVQRLQKAVERLRKRPREDNSNPGPPAPRMVDKSLEKEKEVDLPPVTSAGSFAVTQNFKPGVMPGKNAGEYLTPHTLLKYMRRYAAAQGVDVPRGSTFCPGDIGYIPFYVVGNGLVHVVGGVPIREIENGKKHVFAEGGCGQCLNSDAVEGIYAAAEKARKRKINVVNDITRQMEELREHF